MVQGGVFFDEEFDGAIYLGVTAENEELFAIFEFGGSFQVIMTSRISKVSKFAKFFEPIKKFKIGKTKPLMP